MATSCRPDSEVQSSETLVTHVEHTKVKRQSIGNCWIYAQATWLESLVKSASGEEIDVSESYWTWWHWYDQVVNSRITEIQTGGWWYTSARILSRRGWLAEEDFIASEAGTEMSLAQSRAESYINNQLQKGGTLEKRADRTPENVRAVLDQAFGTDMEAAEKIARSASDTIVAIYENGDQVSAEDALFGPRDVRWQQVSFPRVYGKNTEPTEQQVKARESLLRRVRQALNDNEPVVMTMMIDFNALNTENQTFEASTLAEVGVMGTQGGHMVVLNDYVVDNAPGYGHIGEGEVSPEMKEAALDGDIVHFQAKNSWGTNRPERGLTDGYTRFDWAYLTNQLEWKYGESSSHYTTLTNFVLPAGY
jgi:hypothetical protein